MLIGSIADDLTGATDLAVTLTREGLSVVQVNGVPDADIQVPETDGVVVALKSRTIPASQAVRESLAALAWLRVRGAERVFFKYCSTFDSTADGNIGPVADALMRALGTEFTVATPAYPRNQRTVYLGNLFVGEVPLAESGMRHHPLTPMTDSNLIRVLGQQTDGRVGLVSYPVVERGAQAIRERLEILRRERYRYAILDGVSDGHLLAAGAACLDIALTTGGAGLAMGLARSMGQVGLLGRAGGGPATLPAVAGPAVILSGSCSTATLAQVQAAVARYPSFRLDPIRLAEGSSALEEALAWGLARLGSVPILLYSSAPPEEVAEAHRSLGQERAALLVEDTFRVLAGRFAEAGARRFVVAGGEIAGAAVEALNARALAIGPEIAPGVPWTATLGGVQYLLALKSGNFGGPDFFFRAFEVLS